MAETPKVQHYSTGGGLAGSTASATPTFNPRFVYYTGCTSNAAAGSRTIINSDIVVGAVVCYDSVTGTSGTPIGPSGLFPGDRYERYAGFDVTQPQTAILETFAGVVWRVPSGSVRGGLIEIVSLTEAIDALVTVTGATATGISLGVTNGSWALSVITGLPLTTQAEINSIVKRNVAKVMTPITGAITNTIAKVQVGPSGTGE